MHNNVRGFYIEPTNICTIKCPGCPRTQFINQWPQHWKNHTLDVDLLFRFLDVDLNNRHFILSGNYGDPIYHPDILEFVRRIKAYNSRITLNTNGSYKKSDFWHELVSLLDSGDLIVFAIDGLPENFTEYRINADWASIKQGVDICTRGPCQTKWQYIPFAYNQSNIEQARALSSELGFDYFQVLASDRFDKHTVNFVPNQELLGNRYTAQQNWKSGETVSIDPKCAQGNEHFITADGFYSPCCYLADHRFYYKNIFGKNKSMFDIRNTTFSKLMSQQQVIDFYRDLPANSGCQFNCPAT